MLTLKILRIFILLRPMIINVCDRLKRGRLDQTSNNDISGGLVLHILSWDRDRTTISTVRSEAVTDPFQCERKDLGDDRRPDRVTRLES